MRGVQSYWELALAHRPSIVYIAQEATLGCEELMVKTVVDNANGIPCDNETLVYCDYFYNDSRDNEVMGEYFRHIASLIKWPAGVFLISLTALVFL